MADSDPNETKRRWFEPASAILMALATLSTAWCSYQCSKWNGASSDFATKAVRLEQKAAVLDVQDTQIVSIQVTLFTDFINAKVAGNDKLAQFYSDRFPPELRAAYDRWMAQKPLENPKADPHPFVPSLYKPRFTENIRQATADAGRNGTEARRTGNIAPQYLSITVFLPTVLFFCGTTPRFDHSQVL